MSIIETTHALVWWWWWWSWQPLHGGGEWETSQIDSPARTASCALRSYFESSGRSIIELLLFNPTKVCHRQQQQQQTTMDG